MTNIMGTAELYFSANRTCTGWMVDNTNSVSTSDKICKKGFIYKIIKYLYCNVHVYLNNACKLLVYM